MLVKVANGAWASLFGLMSTALEKRRVKVELKSRVEKRRSPASTTSTRTASAIYYSASKSGHKL